MITLNYRPKTISEIYGQDSIIKEFKNRLKISPFYDKIPQVMLFEGSSGTGKDTLAYIISKLLNCHTPIKINEFYEPCNKCPSCKDVNNEKFIRDIHFFSCSSMGKEEVLKLENLCYQNPMYDKNMILILDEFQNLASSSAKSATLNLIEKPRKNVYFIATTMEIESINKAIIDRCQTYKFKQIKSTIIAENLMNILIKENLIEIIPEEFITEGVFIISENSEGSIRCGQQYLERCINGELYTKDQILNEFGFISKELEFNIIIQLLEKNHNVLNELLKINDLNMFYNKVKKILLNAYVYKVTDKIDENDDWRIKNNKIISKYDTLKILLNCFNSIKTYPYFDKNSFIIEIINYLGDKFPDLNKKENIRIPKK